MSQSEIELLGMFINIFRVHLDEGRLIVPSISLQMIPSWEVVSKGGPSEGSG